MVFRRQRIVRVYQYLATAGSILAAIFGVFGTSQPAQAAQTVPYLINFQGRLTNNAGTTVPDGQYNMRFTLYDAPTGGTNRWQASRVRGASDYRVTVTNGLFNVQFGDTTLGDPALSPSLFNTQTYANLYLEVELPTPATATCATNGCAVFTEGPMTPRQRVASAPYAMQADTLDGLDSDAFVQLSPSGQQTGSINISSSVQAASLQVTGAVQGASATYTGASSLTLGTAGPAGNTGAVLFKNASNTNTLTLQSGTTGSNFAITLPTALTSAGDCLKDTTGAGVLGFASCSAGVSLQTVYDNAASPAQITTSSSAKNFVIKSGSGFNSTGAFQVIPDGTTTPTFIVDTQNNRVGVGVSAPAESLELAGALRVGTTANTNSGAIRWTGTDFEGYDGSNWLSLTNGGLVQTTPTISKRKTSANTSLASTTTFTTESDLNFDIGAGEDWAFHYYVQASVASAPDIKFRINTPSGGTCVWSYQNVEDAVSQSNNACNASVAVTIATAGPLNDGIDLFGSINNPTTAGTVSLDWAPNVSNATATIFRTGSSLTAFRASGTNNPFQALIEGGNTSTAALQFGTTTNQDAVLLTNGTEKLRVDTSGNLKLAATPTASATAALVELDAAIAGGSANGTFVGANPASFSGDFINLQVNGATMYKVNNFGDQTAGMTQLDGSTTTNGTGTNSTSMTVTSSANFNIGNYIQLANTAACQTGGPTTCYAKITNIAGNVLTITPALTWATARPVVEYHVPEIGATNTASTLANRYGRGYFIAGVATGNGTTYYNEDGIESDLTTYSLLGSNVTSLTIGSAGTTVTVPGTLSVTGNISGGTWQGSTVTAGYGGTGQTTYAVGDLLYADTTSSLARRAAVASGSCLVSAGVNTAPVWGSCGSSGASTTLNNLGTTSINADLLPSANNTRSIGSASLVWQNLYTGNVDAGTTTTALTVGTAATTTAITIGRSGLQVSVPGGITSAGAITTSNNISTSGSGTITSAGAFSGPTATNTINGLVISSGSLTNVGANITGAGAVTLASTTSALTLTSGSGTILLGSSTVQRAAAGLTLDVNNAAASTLTVTNSNGSFVASLSVEGGMAIGTGQVYAVGATNGANTTCSGGQFLQDQVVTGGITTGGTCATAGGGTTDLQTAYTNSSSPATITLATGKNLVIASPDVATDPNILINLQCATCSASGGKFAVQDNGTDVLAVNPTGSIVATPTAGQNLAVSLAAGSGTTITATAPPTVDQVSITNSGQAVATANVNGLNITYVGGTGAIESSAQRIDMTPGGTSGATWNGLRLVSTAGASAGVNFNGLKLEGPSSPGTGTETAVNITTGWDVGLAVQSGGIQLTPMTDPTTPSTDVLRVYARNTSGRTMLRLLSQSGVSYTAQPSLFQQYVYMAGYGTAAATDGWQAWGGSGSYTTAPTIVGLTSWESQGYMANFATTAVAGNSNGYMQDTSALHRGSVDGSNGFFLFTRVSFPDAIGSYNGASGARFWNGATSQTTIAGMVSSDAPTGDFAGFRISGSATETTFRFLTRNNTTTTNQNTGVTLAQNKTYDMYIYCLPYDSTDTTQNNTIYWRIDNMTDGTAPVEGSQTLTLPTAITGMRFSTTLATIDATANNMRIQRLYAETDR